MPGVSTLLVLLMNVHVASSILMYDPNSCNDSSSVHVPTSAWGSYYTRGIEDKRAFFKDNIVTQLDASAECTDRKDLIINRYYVHVREPERVMLSYLCIMTMEYQHAEVNMSSAKLLRLADSLSELGITGARDYDSATMLVHPGQVFRLAMPLFNHFKDFIPELAREQGQECTDPAMNTKVMINEKDENELHYWKFAFSCGSGDTSKTGELEVFQDLENCFVNDGNLTLVGISKTLTDNYVYLLWDTEVTTSTEKSVSVSFACFSFILYIGVIVSI